MSLFTLLKLKWFQYPREPEGSFAGKTIIITGANTGVGFEAAIKFAAMGASKLILAVRSIEKGNKAKVLIEQRTARRDFVQVWPLDMLDYDSIKAFASRVHNELDRLDIAVLNAGVLFNTYSTSTYGWEQTLQVNTLSTVLLGLLLLPKLQASQTSDYTSRLVFVSSGTHMALKLTEEDDKAEKPLEVFNDRAHFDGRKQYGWSKLFLMCAVPYVVKLATDPSSGKPNTYVTTVCPSATQSDLARGYMDKWWLRPLITFFVSLFFRSTAIGARTYVSGAQLGEEGIGGFWSNDKLQPTAPLLTGEAGKARLEKVWHEIVDALRKDVPETLELIKA